jgi:hypothetical protein
MGRAIRFAILAAAVPLLAASAATAAHVKHAHLTKKHKIVRNLGIGVTVDEARVITFAQPAKTVFVGNPTIADVNIIDARHAFILGKTFGTTNLIALNENGSQIENKQITVVNLQAAVTVNRGPDSFNYSCTRAHCETAPRPGDPKIYVDNTENAISGHADLGVKSATPAAGQNSQPPVD